MEKWEIHEKHDKEVKEVLTSTGCMIKGQIRRWKGVKTIAALEAAGHDNLDVKMCRCSNERLG